MKLFCMLTLEIIVHFLYLVIFYFIAVYFNDSSYLPTVVKAYLSDDTNTFDKRKLAGN